MGIADVIPGVSGGTIAFITGVYERFIMALRSLGPRPLVRLARGDAKGFVREVRAIHWGVLVPMLGGIALAIVTMSKVVTGLMESRPGPTYAAFFGLIAASAWIPLARMKRFGASHGVALVLAIAGAWMVVGLQAGPLELRIARRDARATLAVYPSTLRSVEDVGAIGRVLDGASVDADVRCVVLDRKNVLDGVAIENGPREMVVLPDKASLEAYLQNAGPLIVLEEQRASLGWIVGCGMIAISAMILPGISGSFLLLFLGQYHAVFSAIHQCIAHVMGWLGREPGTIASLTAHEWQADFLFVGCFLVGVVLGLATFSRVVGWLFEHAHDVTMAVLTGIMIGALRHPGSVVLDEAGRAASAGTYWAIVLGIATLAACVVLTLHFADGYFTRRRAR
jgi:putative membrane protein